MASTDTLTDGVRQGVHSWDGPQMVSNCGIHGYLDRRGKGRWLAIHGWSMNGTVTLTSMDTYTEGGRQGGRPSTDGPWRTTVTVASTDTLTDGVRQGVHPWSTDGQ